jgi:hypothetical protein
MTDQQQAKITIDDIKSVMQFVRDFNQWLYEHYCNAEDENSGDEYDSFKLGRWSSALQVITEWNNKLDDTFENK